MLGLYVLVLELRVRLRLRIRVTISPVRDAIGYETPGYEKFRVRNVWKPLAAVILL